MPKLIRKTYTPEEKARLVAEVEHRYRAGGTTYAAIAKELGIGDATYHTWVKAGIKPAMPSDPTPERKSRLYTPAEREHLVAEVNHLRATGLGTLAACRQVGISEKSYRQWRKPAPAMRPVEITALVPAQPAPPAQEPPLRLVSPGGYAIEGLSVTAAAELLRALS